MHLRDHHAGGATTALVNTPTNIPYQDKTLSCRYCNDCCQSTYPNIHSINTPLYQPTISTHPSVLVVQVLHDCQYHTKEALSEIASEPIGDRILVHWSLAEQEAMANAFAR